MTIEERARAYALSKLDPSMMCYPELVAGLFEEYKEIAAQQQAIDIDLIPQLYVRWLMIDGDKPSWKEYANKALEG